MTNLLIEFANSTSDRWVAWMIASFLDSSLLLIMIGLLWFTIRRHVAPQVGYVLFLLIPLKLLLPVNVTVPHTIAQRTPSGIVSTWFARDRDHGIVEGGSVAKVRIPSIAENVSSNSEWDAMELTSQQHLRPDVHESASPAVPQIQQTIESTTIVDDRSPMKSAAMTGSCLSVSAMAMIIWIFVAAVMSGMLIWKQFRFRKRLQQCQTLDESPLAIDFLELCQRVGVTRKVQIAVSDDVTAPAVWGVSRPTIILPRGIALMLSSCQLQWVLMHELAHIQRCDLLIVAFQRLVAILHFFNPAVWIANRMIHQLREYACDDLAVSLNDGSAIDSGEAFLLILRQASQSPRNLNGALGVFGMDSRTACFERVRRLVDTERPIRTKLDRLSLCGVILLAAITLPHIHAANDAEEAAPRVTKATTPDQATTNAAEPLARDVGEFELNVVGPEGKPIPAAAIEIRTDPLPTLEQIRQGKFVRKGNYGTFVTANSDGKVVMSFPKDLSEFSVHIEMAGYAPYCAEWSSQNHAEPVPAKFTADMDVGWSVGGIVVDGVGNPIQGVEVRPGIQFKKRPGDTSQLGIGTRLKTDEAGKWRFDSVPTLKDTVWVEISHREYMPLRRGLKRSEFGLEQGREPDNKIVLDRGLTVVGKVTDDAGHPIVGARIRTKFSNDIREAMTEVDGSYKLRGCESQMAKIVVSAKGRATDMQELRIVPEMEPVDFEMKAGGKIRIRVLDEKENPIPKARIFFQRWRGGFYSYFEFDNVDQYADEQGVWEWNEAPLDEFQADICRPDGMYLSHQPLIARDEEYVFHPPAPLVILGNVIDATTKEPVKKLDVIPGYRFDSGKLSWDQQGRFTASDGKYRLKQTDGRIAYLVRIESSGYQAAVSRDIKIDEGTVTVDFELKKDQDVAATVLSPDGTPAVGARIALGTVGSQIHLENGDISEISTYCAVENTDDVGKFRFPPQEKACQLVIVHPTGYAYIQAESIPAQIELQAWGRVKGVYRIAGKPVPNVSISIEGIGPNTDGDDVPRIFTTYQTPTGPDGHYVFERVFPGHGRVGREIVMMVVQGAVVVTSSCKVAAQIESGETTHLDFGETGRPIVGRLQHLDPTVKVDWKQILVQVETLLPTLPPLEAPPIPAKIAADATQKVEWLQQWQLTEPGRAWTILKHAHDANEQLRNSRPFFRATLNLDGSFRIDDVPEGEYTIFPLFSGLRHRFSVPHMENGKSDQVLDLGDLKLQK